MPIKILKASAGSGKTYNLAKEYIRLLLTSDKPDAYRHILAVTFTNKATDEMKRRILKELHTLASDTARSPYLGDLVPDVFPTAGAVKAKAGAMLSAILHDYSSFAVSTIDKFFQQTLRAFSREIGRFASYQVELDRDALVDESVERLLDSLDGSNKGLLGWIIAGVKNDLEATGKFTLDRRLRETAANLISLGRTDDDLSREHLTKLRTLCDEVIRRFADETVTRASLVVNILTSADVQPGDFNRGFIKSVLDYTTSDHRTFIPRPTASFLDKAGDPDKWFAKTKAWLLGSVNGVLNGPLDGFCELFGSRYDEYCTAWTIRSQVYMLGVAAELRKAFVAVQKDRNVISIDDTNAILHGIIDGSDTPFVYEKLGVRYEDFLLDEFQDTSVVQWENFLPLLKNSVAEGHETLVVGDVKQSIYRWRGSDWDLLGSRLQKEFNVDAKDIAVLRGNWRTGAEIVAFNNAFFPFAAERLDAITGLDPSTPESISSIYADVFQKACAKGAGEGSVEISFVETAKDEMDKTVEAVRDVIDRGYGYGDIAILVRGNAEGTAVAERLVAENIPVISDDSLYVKSSVTVRRLVSQLSLVLHPDGADGHSAAGFLASQLGITVPGHYHSLPDLCESLLAEIRTAEPATYASETAYVQAFMDHIHDWTTKNGNNLAAFLRDWSDADPKVASPSDGGSVKILTIHKSKGLEFPFVIFPFAEKISIFKPTAYWCRPEVGGTALEAADGHYNVSLSDSSENSLFKSDYVVEKRLQAVDNINVLYVAMTRAKYGLRIIAAAPPKAVAEAVKNGSAVTAKNMSHLLFSFVDGVGEYLYGHKEEAGAHAAAESSGPAILPIDYACRDAVRENRLVFRTKGAEFFKNPDAGDPAPDDDGQD